MNQCYTCGLGTQANTAHTGCEFSSGTNCEYHSSGLTYDLSKMANLQHMYGPITDQSSWFAGHQYFLNLCTKSHVDHACYDKNDNALLSYSCQIPQGGSVAKDLGDVIGFKEFTIAQRSKYPDGGIHVQLTRGSVCHHAGAQQHRSTDILVACSEEDGVGNPEFPPTSSWNPSGSVEPDDMCAYEFLWKSRYGCPLCSIDTGSGGTYRKVGDECDPTTGYKKVSYERVSACIGHPVTGDQLDTYTGPSTFVDTGTELCTPMCPGGTQQVKQVVQGKGTRTTCAKCPKGKYGPGGGVQCEYCAGNTYSYEEGFPECVECGAGTAANGAHTECDTHDCRFNLDNQQFDLKALDKGLGRDDMWGPLRDTNEENGMTFYINMCSRAAADDLNCAGDSGDPIESFVCQRTTLTSDTLGHLVGKNLGDTMGVDSLDPKEGELGLTVKFTHGEKCHHNGAPNRLTTVDMICDDTVGAGGPEPYQGTAEYSYCTYRFSWKTIHACPVCSSDHYTQVVGECAQDTNGAFTQTTTFVKNSTCNTASPVSYKPVADVIASCTQASKGGSGGSSSDTPWYHKPSFFITIIVLTTTLFAVIVTFALVKYWKVRRLYETYAQLDKERDMSNDFTLPESMELSSRSDGGL